MIPDDILNAVALSQDGNAESSSFMYQMVTCDENKTQLFYQTFIEMSRVPMSSGLLPSVPCNIFNSLYLLNQRKDVNDQNWCNSVTSCPEYEHYINAIRFYGYTLLIKLIETKYNQLDSTWIKNDLESFLSGNNTVLTEYSALVCQKLAQYISAIAIHNWPSDWTNFIQFFINSINNQYQTLIFLYFINEVSQELNEDANNTIPYSRKIKISNVLKSNINHILQYLQQTSNMEIEVIKSSWVSLYRNLSSIMPGELMMSHSELLQFKLLDSNYKNYKIDLLYTLYNMSNNLESKVLKDSKNLDIFVQLITSFSFECVKQGLFTYDSDDNEEQQIIANTVKNLVDKNFSILQSHLEFPRLYSLFIQGILPLISHPSMDISIIGMNAYNFYIRKLYSGKHVLKPEDISLSVAAIYLRILKFANPAISIDIKIATILDNFIQSMYNRLLGIKIGDWSKLVSSHYQLNDMITIGQVDDIIYSDFNTKFATLRTKSSSCLVTLANTNVHLLNHSINTLVEIAKLAFTSQAFTEDFNINLDPGKAITWILPKYIIYEAICHIFESLISRVTFDRNNEWVESAKIFYCEMLRVDFKICSNSGISVTLENRKLEFINNTANYLLYQTVPIEEVLDYIFSLISTNDSNISICNQKPTNKIASNALITVCKTCSDLIPNLIQLIVDKLTNLLQVPQLNKALIEETLMLSISCLKNPSEKLPLVESIISPQIMKLISFKCYVSDCDTLLIALFGDNPAIHKSLMVNSIPEFRDTLKRGLVHVTTMLKRMNLQEMSLVCINQMLPVIYDLMFSFVNIWNPQNIEQSKWEWRKPLLCPGVEELESVQWFSSGSAAQVVSFLFPCGDLPRDFVLSARHDLFSIRSSLFRLLGTCSPLLSIETLDRFKTLISSCYKWIPFSHQSNLFRHFIAPLLSDENLHFMYISGKIDFLESFGDVIFQVEKLNNEWLSLRHLKRYLEESNDSSGASRDKYINMYYIRVNYCIENCSLILSIINAVTKWSKGVDTNYVSFKKKILDYTGDSILKVLINSLLWPHVDTIIEGFRLIRQYLKAYLNVCEMFNETKGQFQYNCIEVSKALLNVLFTPRDFDPLHLGMSNEENVNTEFNHFFSLKHKEDGRCFIQSMALTIFTICDYLIKTGPTPNLIHSLQSMLSNHNIFTNEDCDEFIHLITDQKSLKAKSMLRVNIKIAIEVKQGKPRPSQATPKHEDKCESVFDPKIPEYDKRDGEDSFLGESILSLLLE